MAEGEAAGRDPRRLERQATLAAELAGSHRRPGSGSATWRTSSAKPACRRMAVTEARLGRSLSLDETGDAVCETAARLDRRWSETRRDPTAVNELAYAAPEDGALADAGTEVLTAEEREILARISGTAPSAE